jgi:hypothetical protein
VQKVPSKAEGRPGGSVGTEVSFSSPLEGRWLTAEHEGETAQNEDDPVDDDARSKDRRDLPDLCRHVLAYVRPRGGLFDLAVAYAVPRREVVPPRLDQIGAFRRDMKERNSTA